MHERGYLFDTVTLSNFALTGSLDLVLERYGERLWVTDEILDELAEGVASGYPDLQAIEDCVYRKQFSHVILSRDERKIFNRLLGQLNAGDASCVAVAYSRNGIVATDDRAARSCCAESEIPFTGTIGILKASYLDGCISLEEADNKLFKMEAEGFYSPVRKISDLT